jgi:AhpD family alkylhydroperoxidase
MGEMKQSVEQVSLIIEEASPHQPETIRPFKRFTDSTSKDGVVDTKTKEVVARDTTITIQCEYCIPIHVEKALQAGATKEEIFEIAVIVIFMGSDSAMTYNQEVQKAANAFAIKGEKT